MPEIIDYSERFWRDRIELIRSDSIQHANIIEPLTNNRELINSEPLLQNESRNNLRDAFQIIQRNRHEINSERPELLIPSIPPLSQITVPERYEITERPYLIDPGNDRSEVLRWDAGRLMLGRVAVEQALEEAREGAREIFLLDPAIVDTSRVAQPGSVPPPLSSFIPRDWSEKRYKEIVNERLKVGVDRDITATAMMIKQFECPDTLDGKPTFSDDDEMTVLLAAVCGEAERKLPSKDSTLSLVFRREETRGVYEMLREKSKDEVKALIDAEESPLTEVIDLKHNLEMLISTDGVISAQDQSKALKNLKTMGRVRKTYATVAQDWLRTHSTAPAELLVEAWKCRNEALRSGVADNPKAIKKWGDHKKLQAEIARKKSEGALPEDFTQDLLEKYRPYVNELLVYYDGKRGAPADPARTIINTLLRHREIFNPDYLIPPTKIKLHEGWTAEILEKDDPRGYMLGYQTDCCMHPAGQGSTCVDAAYSDPRYGIMAMYDEKGVLAAHSLLYTAPDSAPGVLVIDDIEVAKGRNLDAVAHRYREFFDTVHEQSEGDTFGFSTVQMGVADEQVYYEFTTRVPTVYTPRKETYTDASLQVLLWEAEPSNIGTLNFVTIKKSDQNLVNKLGSRIYGDLNEDVDFDEHPEGFFGPLRSYNYFVHDSSEDDGPIGYVLATYGEMTYEIEDEHHLIEDVVYVEDLALLPEHQGKTNGFKIFKKIMEIAERHNAPILFHAKDDTSWQIIKDRQKVLERYGYRFDVIMHEADYYEDDLGAHFVRVSKIASSVPDSAVEITLV